MKEKKYIDGLHYELRDEKYDSKENLISAEIYAQMNGTPIPILLQEWWIEFVTT